MTTYRDIPDAEVLQDEPITQVLMQGLRDNAIAVGFGIGKGQITPATIPAATATQNTSGAVQEINVAVTGAAGIVSIQTSPDGTTWTEQGRMNGTTSDPVAFSFSLPIAWRWRWIQISGGANVVTRQGLSA